MVRVTFLVDGLEISTEDLNHRPADPVDRVMLLAARKHVQRRLGDLSCPRHGSPPRIIASGPSPDRLTFSVEGCCQKLRDRAARALENDEANPFPGDT